MKISINKNKCKIESFNIVPEEGGFELYMKVKDEDIANKLADVFSKVVIDYIDDDPEALSLKSENKPEQKSEPQNSPKPQDSHEEQFSRDVKNESIGEDKLSKYTLSNSYQEPERRSKLNENKKEVSATKKKILVIEDDEMINKVISNKMKNYDIEIITAKDGDEGIKKIMNDLPDLIITDLMMPYVNGLEVVEYVRDKIKIKVPIIALSAIEDEDTILTAFKMGVDDYVTKPFGPDELLLRIKRLLSISDKSNNLRVTV